MHGVRGGDGAGACRAESEALKRLAEIAHRFRKPMRFSQLLDDALSYYRKYTEHFDIDAVPEAERRETARLVADAVLSFALGVMNLVWMAALTVFMLIEKISPMGRFISRAAGIGLIAWGGWMLF